ncbi:hypothetical protein [Borrelia persica]|uniref:hypothetical protein n=1 Tax=Borrelia persica TaxID=44448 RepID=UPI0004668FAF|nr:hypothetical protein [Borrelia persica]
MMKRSMVLFLFVVLFLACGQNGDSAKTDRGRLGQSVRSSLIQRRGIVGDLDTLAKGFDVLKTSLDNLKALYYFRDDGLSMSLYSDIDAVFQISDKIYISDKNIYATLMGNINAVNNLKKIVIDVNETKLEYEDNSNGHILITQLDHLSQFTISKIIGLYYSAKNVEIFEKLKSIKDIKFLQELQSNVDDFYTKWRDMVLKIQTIINNVAVVADEYIKIKGDFGKDAERLALKKSIKSKLRPIILLNLNNPKQVCSSKTSQKTCADFRLCKLKNELFNLANQIFDKTYGLSDVLK